MTEQDYINATNLRAVRIMRHIAAMDLLFMNEANTRLRTEICVRLDLLEDTLAKRVEESRESQDA